MPPNVKISGAGNTKGMFSLGSCGAYLSTFLLCLFFTLSPASESGQRFFSCKHHRWFPLFLPSEEATSFSPRCEHVGVLSLESGEQVKQNRSQSPGTWNTNDYRENCGLLPLAIHLLWVVQLISNASTSWQLWQGAVMQWEVREGSLAGKLFLIYKYTWLLWWCPFVIL